MVVSILHFYFKGVKMISSSFYQKKSIALWFLSAIFIFSSNCLFSQVSLRANLDASHFKAAESGHYLEVYYSIADAVFADLQTRNNSAEAEIIFNLVIKHGGAVWATKVWKIAKSVNDSTLAKSQNVVVDALRYMAEEAGDYEIKLYTRADGAVSRIDSAMVTVTIPQMTDDEMCLSDVIFSSKIGRATEQSNPTFTRNGYEIIPNAAAVFGESAPIVYYYFEAYNISKKIAGDKYKVVCKIVNSNGKEVEGTGKTFRTKRKTGETAIEMGTKIISKLPSGTYSLVFGLADIDEKIVMKNRKTLYIYNPSIPVEKNEQLTMADVGDKSFIDLYRQGEKELDLEFKKMIYLIDKEQKDFYKKLKLPKAKADYIKEIWINTAAKQNIVGSVYRFIYLKRINEANVKFKSVFKEGWKSDRGRVYILYGPPYEVERFPNSTQTIPYEIWTYSSIHGQGGVIFIFSDRTGFKKYEQIHSTLIGELQEPDWQRLVMKGAKSDYTTNPFQN